MARDPNNQKFIPGESGNPNGRPKGSVNRKTKEWEVFREYMLNEGLIEFTERMSRLKDNQFCNVMVQLFEYFKPKQQRTEIVGDEEKPLNNKLTIETIYTVHNKPKEVDKGNIITIQPKSEDLDIEFLNEDERGQGLDEIQDD